MIITLQEGTEGQHCQEEVSRGDEQGQELQLLLLHGYHPPICSCGQDPQPTPGALPQHRVA